MLLAPRGVQGSEGLILRAATRDEVRSFQLGPSVTRISALAWISTDGIGLTSAIPWHLFNESERASIPPRYGHAPIDETEANTIVR